MTTVTIRDVDPEIFRKFKIGALERKMKLGSAVTLAMMKFLTELAPRKQKFTNIKPVHWGKGTEHVSEQVDEILYG